MSDKPRKITVKVMTHEEVIAAGGYWRSCAHEAADGSRCELAIGGFDSPATARAGAAAAGWHLCKASDPLYLWAGDRCPAHAPVGACVFCSVVESVEYKLAALGSRATQEHRDRLRAWALKAWETER